MNFRQNRYFLSGVILLVALYAYSLFGGADRFVMTPFREGQTAITAYYMAKGESPFLQYEVPVLGEPWSVPMEFPIFQWLASKIGGDSIDRLRWAGRLLSLVFWGGCLMFASLLLRRSPLGENDRRWFILLLAAAPVYLTYSSAFLIETFALFFALGYLWSYMFFRDTGKWFAFFMTGAFGAMAVLSKPTTWAPFAGVIILLAAFDFFLGIYRKSEVWSFVFKVFRSALLVIIPLVIGMVWVHYGDATKVENPLARSLTSDSLSAWNYGTLKQKISPSVWSVIFGKQGVLLLGLGAVIFPFLFLLAASWMRRDRSTLDWPVLLWIFFTLAGYLSAPAVFTNLHFRHDYYVLANGTFLIAVFVLCLHVLRSAAVKSLWLNLVYVITFISMCLTSFGYLALKQRFEEPQEAALLEVLETIPDGPVVFNGFGWSSKMPFELERRALMVNFRDRTHPNYEEVIELNDDIPWQAVVSASPKFSDASNSLSEDLVGGFEYEYEIWPGLTLHVNQPLEIYGVSLQSDLLSRIDHKLEGVSPESSGVVYVHSLVQPKSTGEGVFECMIRRGGDLFYFDGQDYRFYRIRNYF